MESVAQKMYRAGQHWEELTREMAAYLDTSPGGLVEMPDSTPERTHHRWSNTEPLPARLGLIAGDCVQNMRSALDYLVWELVLVNCAQPTERNMFPVAMTEKAFKEACKRGQLAGVSDEPVTLIDALQPYRMNNPEHSLLRTLDLLANINKHRRVPLTSLQSAAPTVQFDFLHLPMSIERRVGEEVIETIPLRIYVAIEDSIAKGREVCLILNTMAEGIAHEVLPHFEKFFSARE